MFMIQKIYLYNVIYYLIYLINVNAFKMKLCFYFKLFLDFLNYVNCRFFGWGEFNEC